MRRLVAHPQVRELLPPVLVGGLAALLLAVAVAGPWSPLTVRRAEAAVAAGDPDSARALYVQTARWALTDTVRAEALWNAAQISAVELGEPQRAVRLLRQLTELETEGVRAAVALARLAEINDRDLRRPLRAAPAWESAAHAMPSHPRAGEWLLAAADAWSRADREPRAHAALRQVRDHYPEQAADAELRIAEDLLVADAARAYELYQDVANEGSETQVALARFGLSVALERLGDTDAALVELEEAGLPDDVEQQRRARMEERAAQAAP